MRLEVECYGEETKSLVIIMGAPGYEHIRSLDCSCGHVSVREPSQLAPAGWVHACPGCGTRHRLLPWADAT